MRFIKGLISALFHGATLPCPMWLALCLMFSTAAGAAGIIDYAAGGFVSGSSTYGPTSATVNGPITATNATLSGNITDSNSNGNLVFSGAGQGLVQANNGFLWLVADGSASSGVTLDNETPATNTIARFQSGGTTKSSIDSGGYYWAGASNFGPTSSNVNGTLTAATLNDTGLTASSGVICTDASKNITSTGCTAGTTYTGTAPIGVSGSAISCATCLTTAGAQTVTGVDTFGGAPAKTPVHAGQTINNPLVLPVTAATTAGSQPLELNWVNGSGVQNEWQLDTDNVGDLCLAYADTCTDFLDASNIFHVAGANINGATTVAGLITSTTGGGSCTGVPATNGACFGSFVTSANSIFVGWENASPYTCAASCGTATSQPIELCGMGGSGPLCQTIYTDSSGVLNLGKVKIYSSLDMAGDSITRVSKLTQYAAGDLWGSCAMSASTSCTITWTYAPTYCSRPNPVGTTLIDGAANISSATITITAASSNSETWDVSCS